MTINLDLLADACRRRFEGDYDSFRAALDAAYPTVTDARDGLWDLPLPDDGPGTDDPTDGPSEVYVASLVAHVADTYAALFPAAPPVAPVALSPVPAGDCTAASAVAPSCDVRGCESTRALRSVLLGRRYEVTLCAGHARAVRR